MTSWRYIDSGACDAAYNMALDEAIAAAVRKGDSPPTLRFYGWLLPAVSLGAFQGIAISTPVIVLNMISRSSEGLQGAGAFSRRGAYL